MKNIEISELIGATISKIVGAEKGSRTITFYTNKGVFQMCHDQECCESVNVDDIVGDIEDIIGSPILRAEEKTNSDDTFGRIEYPDSFTWTFYTLATIKGYVDIKWLGESNGYYSESVEFEWL